MKKWQEKIKKNMIKHKDNIIKIIIMIICIITIIYCLIINVKAQTYTNDTNISENTTYVNQLIDLSVNQEKDIENKKYAIYQIEYNYYLVIFKDYTINGNRITANNTTIYRAIRTQQSNYNYIYTYSKINENQTIINANYLIYGNIEIITSMENQRMSEYMQKERIKKGIIFIIGIIFVIMLLKGRDKV